MAGQDDSCLTFSVADEDHTLGNTVRYMLNQDPRVTFCGYTVPHPNDNRVNIRVQTTGESAKEVFKDALKNLVDLCDHVTGVFETEVKKFKQGHHQSGTSDMEVDKRQELQEQEESDEEEEEVDETKATGKNDEDEDEDEDDDEDEE